MSTEDSIGVSREHRWSKAADQERKLKPLCRAVLTLGGGKCTEVTRTELEMLVRPGTVIRFVHAFLLADPKKRVGMVADFDAALDRLTARGAIVEDVEIGLKADTKMKRDALRSHAHTLISRSNQGRRSALNGKRSRGRQKFEPTAEQTKEAKAVWRNPADYPNWTEASKAMPKGFTVWRANKMFGPRPKLKM